MYAIFNGLGTPTHLAAVSFLNSEKVPDLFVASGCECWDQPTLYPETFGYQLDYVREGKILGQYVAQHFKGKKIGYFYQDDEFGMDGVKGLNYEIPSSMVVSKQSYVATNINIAPQVAALRASGAQVVVAFSVPAFTALLKLDSLKLGFSPTLVVSDVNNDVYTLDGLLQSFAKQGGATVSGSQLTDGIITDSYLPVVADTSNSWVALFKMIHDQYDAKEPWDGNTYYGEAVAYTFVQAMLNAGRNPTRADLVSAVNAGLPQGPMVAPFAYSATNHDGVTGAFMAVMKNGGLTPEGSVLITDTSATGPITTSTGSEEQAPASGIPSALLLLRPHRPSRTGTEQGSAEMTAEASRMAGGRARPPSAPSGRPGERPPAQRLLTAAEELFGERSYHRTTVAHICSRAGMATGSFYSYFGSKAEIFAAVVRAINTDLRRAMKEALDHTEGGQRNRERASFRAYFDMLSARPWIDRIVRESEFVDPGLFREYYEHLARGYARGVRAAQMDRDIDARYDPEVIAYAYTGIGNFVGMRWAEWTAGGQVPEDVLDDVLELLARGLAPKVTGPGHAPAGDV